MLWDASTYALKGILEFWFMITHDVSLIQSPQFFFSFRVKGLKLLACAADNVEDAFHQRWNFDEFCIRALYLAASIDTTVFPKCLEPAYLTWFKSSAAFVLSMRPPTSILEGLQGGHHSCLWITGDRQIYPREVVGNPAVDPWDFQVNTVGIPSDLEGGKPWMPRSRAVSVCFQGRWKLSTFLQAKPMRGFQSNFFGDVVLWFFQFV